jgi:hypothetical protein
LSDSLFICFSEKFVDSLETKEIKYIDLYTETPSELRDQGWFQLVGWPAIGYLVDTQYKKDDEKQNYNCTIVGGVLGLTFGSLMLFDENQIYETIYVRQ